VQAQLTESTLLLSELKQITTQVSDQKKRRIRSRKSLQKGGSYSVAKAHRAIAEKKSKEQKKSAEKEARAFKKLQNTERRMQERKGIDARRAERDRKKTILQLQKRGDHIPIELLTPIPDPDVERKIEEERRKGAQLDEEMEDHDQSDGFIAFDSTSEEAEEEEDLIDPALFTWEL